MLARLYTGANPEDPNEPGLTPVVDAIYNDELFHKPHLESGGDGLLFTLKDIARLLNALDLENGQLLGRDTLKLIYQNMLPEGLWMQFPGYGELVGKGHSAACSVSVAAFPSEHPDTAGTCWWGGVAGTQWWISPKDRVSVAVMTQRENAFAHPFATELRNLVYEALEA